MSVDKAVDKDKDMKYGKGQDGVSIITIQICEIVEKLFFLHLIWNTLKCPRTISPVWMELKYFEGYKCTLGWLQVVLMSCDIDVVLVKHS